MKHYFLGRAANYSRQQIWAHTFAYGTAKDSRKLCNFLAHKYQSDTEHIALTKNGRSALALALKANFKKGDEIIVNGFTCYAVIEAVKAAGLTPVFADIDETTLHFNTETLAKVITKNTQGLIIQNTFGIPVDITAIEKFATVHNLKIIEDLAHCAGVHYKDGREAGTVGVATVLSFGKDKSIDTISGGAVILRDPCLPLIPARSKAPKLPDRLRARFYPLFGATYRTLTHIHLASPFMALLLKIHWIERSADNTLDLTRRCTHWQAKLALKQLQNLPSKPLRTFYLVKNRDEVLAKLAKSGYYFDGFWYETPVAPARYYQKTHFPESDCPIATRIAQQIINLPNYYTKTKLNKAIKIIKEAS